MLTFFFYAAVLARVYLSGNIPGEITTDRKKKKKSSLPDIDNPNQLFGHKPQCECIQQEGEDTEHHLR